MLTFSRTDADAREHRPLEQLRVDDPQLGEQQRDRRDPGRDVQSLGEPVEAGGARDRIEPARRVLLEVRPQPGGEAHR